MWIIFPLILGVVQGLAEFLPISSSGHLALFQNFFGDGLAKYNDATAFTVLLHLGTLVAVFIVYRKDIAKMIPAFFTMMKKLCAPQKYKLADYTLEERLDLLVIIGTLPLVFLYILDILVGKIFDFELLDTLDNIISGQPIVIGVILIFNGLMLFFSDNLQGREKPMERFTLKNGLFVGICQMVSALLPGLSRSGSTITGSRLSGMSCPDAVRYSLPAFHPGDSRLCRGQATQYVLRQLFGSRRLGGFCRSNGDCMRGGASQHEAAEVHLGPFHFSFLLLLLFCGRRSCGRGRNYQTLHINIFSEKRERMCLYGEKEPISRSEESAGKKEKRISDLCAGADSDF